MGAVQDLVTEISTEGGFEITAATALTVLDRRHKQMCARARWHRVTRLSTVDTVANATYSTVFLPLDAVEVFSVGFPSEDNAPLYTRTNPADRSAILEGTLVVRGTGGVFVEETPQDETDTTPETMLLLYPSLEDGISAYIQGAFLPPTLTTAETGGAFIRVPVDFYEPLLAGVYATLLGRPGESRPDLAAVQEQAFAAGCAELEERASLRYRTRGPRQIRIVGQTI